MVQWTQAHLVSDFHVSTLFQQELDNFLVVAHDGQGQQRKSLRFSLEIHIHLFVNQVLYQGKAICDGGIHQNAFLVLLGKELGVQQPSQDQGKAVLCQKPHWGVALLVPDVDVGSPLYQQAGGVLGRMLDGLEQGSGALGRGDVDVGAIFQQQLNHVAEIHGGGQQEGRGFHAESVHLGSIVQQELGE